MRALTPSGPRKCSQMGPCFGSKTRANVKKGQHPRSTVMNCMSLFAQLSLPGIRLPGRIHGHMKKLAIAGCRRGEGASLSGAQRNERVCFDDNTVFLESALPAAYDLTIQHHCTRQQTAARV